MIKRAFLPALGLLWLLLCLPGCQDEPQPAPGTLQLSGIQAGNDPLDLLGSNDGIPVDAHYLISFTSNIDTASAKKGIFLEREDALPVAAAIRFETDFRTARLTPAGPLEYLSNYNIRITNEIKGRNGESFQGLQVSFSTGPGLITLETISLNGQNFMDPFLPRDISYESIQFVATFSAPLDPSGLQTHFSLAGEPISVTLSEDGKQVTVNNSDILESYIRHSFSISSNLEGENGFRFYGFSNFFYTALDSSYKFPEITDEELLDLVQESTFRYFYDFAHPVSGLTRERNNSGDIVTTGGSGFGLMALVTGMERQFITRPQGLDRLDKVLDFLETSDRFHGAWPHWLNGVTGQVYPFSTRDDGADLVETAFLVQGLITVRQYLDPGHPQEQGMISRIQELVDAVEWSWFTRGQDVLYWHWSPNYGWEINMQIRGYSEALIVYVLAAASSTYSIESATYHSGYARNGAIVNGNSYYGYTLPLGWDFGGPLFFTHYSHLGLDPRNLRDAYADYWEQGVNMSLINRAYCVDNPKEFVGYSEDSWGLTASDNPWGYNAHSPTNDLGVIAPTAAISALPYTPEQSMEALRHFYYILGDKLWGEYGFYDAFSVTEGWWAGSYLAIDQGPIVCMIENHRTGLLWDLFMSAPEVQQGLTKLGFTY